MNVKKLIREEINKAKKEHVFREIIREEVRRELNEITTSNISASGQNNSSRWTAPGQARKANIMQLVGFEQLDFPVAQDMVADYGSASTEFEDLHIDQGVSAKYNNRVRRDADGQVRIGGRRQTTADYKPREESDADQQSFIGAQPKQLPSGDDIGGVGGGAD